MLSAVLVLALPLAAEPSIDSVRDLLAVTSAYQARRPIGKETRDRAWSAFWNSESDLSTEDVAALRQLLLKVDEQRGSLRGIAMSGPAPQAPWINPEEDERAKLFKRVDKFFYPHEIKELLSVIVEYAPLRDAELAVDLVRDEKPRIQLDSRDMSLDTVGDVTRNSAGPTIHLRPGVALVPVSQSDKGGSEISVGGARWHPIPASEPYYKRLGTPIPALDVFKPTAHFASVGAYYGGEIFLYPDGSGYHRFSNSHLAGVLLHELMHLQTRRLGGGASESVDELHSFLPQFRLYYNVQKRMGTGEFLDVNRQGYSNWLENPVSLGYFLEAAYTPGAKDKKQPGGVFEAIDETKRVLKLKPDEFEKAKLHAMEKTLEADDTRRRIELGYLSKLGLAPAPPPAAPPDEKRVRNAAKGWDYRAALTRDMNRLSKDALIELEARLADFSWREAEGIDKPAATARKLRY
jgi:hypothetical protein